MKIFKFFFPVAFICCIPLTNVIAQTDMVFSQKAFTVPMSKLVQKNIEKSNLKIPSIEIKNLKSGYNIINLNSGNKYIIKKSNNKITELYLEAKGVLGTNLIPTIRQKFTCDPVACACKGTQDCNDMFTTNVCRCPGVVCNSVCIGEICICSRN